MSAAKTPPLVWLGIGLFLGILVGIVAVTVATSEDTSESYEAYRERMQANEGHPQLPASHPPTGAPPAPAEHGGAASRAQESFAKVHFMKKFVAALSSLPENMFPNPAYEPLLKGNETITCADCHDDSSLNLDTMIENDPGAEAVEPYRQKRRQFMVPLMKAWVKRLNERQAGKLRKPVTCTDCHAWEPGSPEGNQVLPPLMINFVRALTQEPRNKDPAPRWKPLLENAGETSLLCSRCHGDIGRRMEQGFQGKDLPRPDAWADNRAFMIHLMERWVKRLNREMADELTKAVSCIDCHEKDPRR